MKAIILQQQVFESTEMPQPVPGDGEVLVRITAAAFNPIDYQMRQGAKESQLLKSTILGREMAGVVVAKGNNSAPFAVGDAVAAYIGRLGSNGAFAEYSSVPVQLLAPKPKGISFAEAAALPMAGMTALQCFDRLAATPGATIFMSGGAGGVGTILIKLWMAHGITNIVTTAGNAQSRAHLLALGITAENCIDYRQPDYQKAIEARSEHGSFAICVDLVGGSLSEMCSTLVKVNGTYVDVTNAITEKARGLLFDKAVTVLHVANYAYTLTGNPADTAYYGTALKRLFTLIESGILSPAPVTIVGDYSTTTVEKALQLLENNQAQGRKLVMTIP